jgi:hypothetical protein
MSETDHRTKNVAEALAPYASDSARTQHTKLSISLPADLVEMVRAIATDSGTTVSAVIGASLRRTIDQADQERLDRALELDAEENLTWANAYLPIAARLWVDIEW